MSVHVNLSGLSSYISNSTLKYIYIYSYVHMYIESFPRMCIKISSHDLRMSCEFSKKTHVRKTKEVKHVYRHSI